MDYAIKLLKEEREVILSAIKLGNWEGYSDALKDRKQKVQEIDEAINILQWKYA